MGNDTVYTMVTERILSLLEAGVAPWRKPWRADVNMPRSLATGRPYRGVNVFLLMMQGYESPYWATFNQVRKHGGQVNKGESSTVVVFWKRVMVKDPTPEDPNRKRQVPMLRYFRVFNVEQTTLPDMRPDVPEITVSPIDAAEKIVSGYVNIPGGPAFNEKAVAGAFYLPTDDTITIPNRGRFDNAELFYKTAFHEMGHSTGHVTRCDRWSKGHNWRFGCKDYGREELVAEMTAAFLSAEAGIMAEVVENNAQYVADWRNTIKADNRAVVVAAGAAQKAADHILGRKPYEDSEGSED